MSGVFEGVLASVWPRCPERSDHVRDFGDVSPSVSAGCDGSLSGGLSVRLGRLDLAIAKVTVMGRFLATMDEDRL